MARKTRIRTRRRKVKRRPAVVYLPLVADGSGFVVLTAAALEQLELGRWYTLGGALKEAG